MIPRVQDVKNQLARKGLDLSNRDAIILVLSLGFLVLVICLLRDASLFGFCFLGLMGLYAFTEFANSLRQSSLRRVAKEHSLEFQENDISGVSEACDVFTSLSRGDLTAYNIVTGSCQEPGDMQVFDLQPYGSDKNPVSISTLEFPREFPPLLVTREGRRDKVAQGLGFEDIDFDNVQFSERYKVTGDKEFAYAFFTPRMMECFSELDSWFEIEHEVQLKMNPALQTGVLCEVASDRLLLKFPILLKPKSIPGLFERVGAMRKLMPGYLFEESCPNCGGRLNYMNEYRDYYCESCEAYLCEMAEQK